MDASDAAVIKQHLIDPEICIRCNTCEAICPVKAISHDSNNYVVDAAVCNLCMACISPCPTGSIDNIVVRVMANRLDRADRLAGVAADADLGVDQVLLDDNEV